MTQRLVRVFLAIAVAFVFTGRMEAAAQHCARLLHAAEAAEPVPEVETVSCHGIHEPAKAGHHPMHDGKAGDRCECIAVLSGYTPVASAARWAHIEPYAWARPEGISFASIEPAPALKPPRA